MNGTSLKHIEHYREEQNSSEHRLLIISRFAQDLIKLSSCEELLHYVTQQVVAQIGFVDCVIYLLDEDRNVLVQKSAFGEKQDDQFNIIDAIEIPIGQGITGNVALSVKPVIIEDTTHDERYIYDIGAGYSEICVPIVHNGKLLGVIDSEHPDKNFYTEEHLSFLTTIATMLASRLHEWYLVQELNKSREELREAVEIAEKSNKIKTDFLASMSHDLRTPLNAIIGFSELMKEEIFGEINNKRYANYVSDIHNSSQYLLSLVNDILDLSALEANERILTYSEHDLGTLLNKCHDLLYKLAEDKMLDFTVDVDESLPLLYADEHAIMQILMNVVSNAIKFTPEKGAVSLKASYSESGHRICVTDTGIGISKDNIELVKKPFSREIDSPLYTDSEGTGLGLAIVNSLVSLHGGTLDINSERYVGTKVIVVLPSK